MAICNRCFTEKPDSAFAIEKVAGKLYPRKACKVCRNKAKRTTFSRHGFGLRQSALRRLYGITIQQYDDMYEAQGGVCKICKGNARTRWGDRLAVDHCHSTGKVRGLLCDKCNKGLGQFSDNEEIMLAAIAYLKA